MIRLIAALLILTCTAPSFAEDWKPLFNGKDLEGWTPKIRGHEAGENYANTFRVEDGLLKVRFDEYEGPYRGRFGHLFYEKPFSHYKLRVEYRVVGDQYQGGPDWANRNSGVMIHGQSPESMAIDQQFPVCVEVQLLAGQGRGPRTTANLCTPGTHVVMDGKLNTNHCISSTSETYDQDLWVTVEIEARGSEVIRHIIDGKTVIEYNQPQYDPKDKTAQPLIEKAKAAGAAQPEGGLLLSSGTISLQAESHPVDFRKVELLELEP